MQSPHDVPLNDGQPEQSTVLSKIFSREKTLFYFSMWDQSDRLGWRRFLGHDVENNLFIIPPKGRKGSVWYSSRELALIEECLRKGLLRDSGLVESLRRTLDTQWEYLYPYLSDVMAPETIDEFEAYYDHLVTWWSAMNTAFGVPDMGEEIDLDIRELFLDYRASSEKYTEKMNSILLAFWQRHFPQFPDIDAFVAPHEVRLFVDDPSQEFIESIRAREQGCVRLNGDIALLSELEDLLGERNLALEADETGEVSEIQGRVAYTGHVKGSVKKISSFDDMKDFQAGSILVTEMTNPEYVPIMRVAAAIVTDEGGMTCHAAIASRELQVPCVVGTKIATRILHDGDLVEVDADNGIVRIIERVNSNS